MNDTMTIFDYLYPKYKITKPIRLIECFAGYGSQALALKYLEVPFEHWKICEWAVKSIQAYKDIHFTDDNTDYSKSLNKDQIQEFLFNKGISSNYNEPMTREQINRQKEDVLRKIYNNIQITHNLVNIQQVKGIDLEISDTDKYNYVLTYSFPCQDLSLAGKGKGMSDTSTRSGMLWEVERILTECYELGLLPQILLMENVPQVHSQDNLEDFNKWKSRLEELGYKNYFQDLIATDYGIPQTRNRCFMISILGDYSYTFPKPIPLEKKLKDMLEDNVDEKYYLSDRMIKYITKNGEIKPKEDFNVIDSYNKCLTNSNYSGVISTGQGNNKGSMLMIKNATKKGYLEAEEDDGVDISSRMEHHRGTVQKSKTQTLTTSGGNDRGVVVGTYDFSSSERFLNGKDRFEENNGTFPTLRTSPKEGVVFKPKVIGGIGEKDSNNGTQWKQQNRIYDEDCAITVTTCCNPYYKNNLRIRKLTPRECFRLQGVKDEDYKKCTKNQSDSSLYHLAGDSIVVNVLMAIFKELL